MREKQNFITDGYGIKRNIGDLRGRSPRRYVDLRRLVSRTVRPGSGERAPLAPAAAQVSQPTGASRMPRRYFPAKRWPSVANQTPCSLA